MSASGVTPHGLPRVFSEDPAAFAEADIEPRRLREAFALHFELVWRSLRRFGVPESAADDAAQHVFLTFSARSAKIELGRERAFLVATALRVAANERRRIDRAREVPFDDAASESGASTPESLLEEKRRRHALDEALRALPIDQRAVFVLYELEGFTLPEIAQSLEIPLGTATSRLRRARARFETWVETHAASGEMP